MQDALSEQERHKPHCCLTEQNGECVNRWQSKETRNRDEKEKVLAEKLYQRRNNQIGPSAVKISNDQVAGVMHTKMWSVCHGGASVGRNWMAGMIHKNSKRIKTMFNCPISQKVKKKTTLSQYWCWSISLKWELFLPTTWRLRLLGMNRMTWGSACI